jgi:hypothetical protein
MSTFSVKSIGLYSLAIGSAIVFFHFVTSYGEANIKAPTSITGNYLVTIQNPPNCLQRKQLLLKIQQSGIYLNASLVEDRQAIITSNDSHPTFSGQLRDRKLNLIGLLPPEICPQSPQLQVTGLLQSRSSRIVKINSQANRFAEIQGQLQFTTQGQKTLPASSLAKFTATFQPSIDQKSTQSH